MINIKNNIKNNKSIRGFTLSEVLITLAVIGVIAAITIPVLSFSWQKQALKTAFIKTYADLNNFSRKFYYDYDVSFTKYCLGKTDNNSCINMMMSYFTKLGIASNNLYSTSTTDEDLQSYNLRLLSGKSSGTGAHSYISICDNSKLFADLSGRLYRFNDPPGTGGIGSTDANGPIVCVDINGLKGPNKYGNDYFLFVFTVDGKVIPMGMPDENNSTGTDFAGNAFVTGSEYCSKTGTAAKYNAACAYYALADKHPSNPNKTYWRDFL